MRLTTKLPIESKAKSWLLTCSRPQEHMNKSLLQMSHFFWFLCDDPHQYTRDMVPKAHENIVFMLFIF